MKGKKIIVQDGERFECCTIIREIASRNGYRYFKCLCDCGNVFETKLTLLRTGQTKSCGCHKNNMLIERNTKHKLSRTALYKVHTSMMQRCFNSKCAQYKYYGGRGIVICDDWLNFEVFHNWAIENGYDKGLTIDRINNDGNYTSDNCRWVTMKVQSTNKRKRI